MRPDTVDGPDPAPENGAAAASASDPAPARSVAKRPRKPSNISLEEALREFRRLEAEDRSSFVQVQSALGDIARALPVDSESARALASQIESSREATTNRIGLELSFHPELLERTDGRSASWFAADPAWGRYLSVSASTFVTARHLSAEIATAQRRRGLLRGALPAGSVDDPRLVTDQNGIWSPPAGGAAPAAAPEAPTTSTVRFAIERELATRGELLSLARVERNDRVSFAAFPLAKRALEQAITTIVDIVESNLPLTESQWILSFQIFTTVGRNPDIWDGLARSRLKLIRCGMAEESNDRLRVWAHAVGATWCTTDASVEAVRPLASAKLACLCRAARDHNAMSLLKQAQMALQDRAAASSDDDELWDVLVALLKESPAERSWVDPITAIRTARLTENEAFRSARTLSPAQLRGEDFVLAVRAVDAATALPAIAHAASRLAFDDQSAAERAREDAKRKVQVLQAKLSALPSQLADEFGGMPGGIAQLCHDAQSELVRVAREIDEDGSVVSNQLRTPASRTEPEGQMDLAVQLHALAFDPRRSDDATRALRDATMKQLLNCELAERRDVVSRLGQLVDLPPETVGVVLEVGVLERDAELLRDLPALLEVHSWASRQWDEIVLSAAGSKPAAVPVDAHVAEATVERLLQRLREPRQHSFRLEQLDQRLAVVWTRTATIRERLQQARSRLDQMIRDLPAS